MCPVLEPLSGHQAGFVTQTTRKFTGTLASLPFNVTGSDLPGADAAQMLTKPMAGKRVRAIELGIETLTSQGCKHACCCAFNLVVPLTQALGGLEEIHRVLNVKLPPKCKCGILLLWPLGIPVVVYAGIRTLCHLGGKAFPRICKLSVGRGMQLEDMQCLAHGWPELVIVSHLDGRFPVGIFHRRISAISAQQRVSAVEVARYPRGCKHVGIFQHSMHCRPLLLPLQRSLTHLDVGEGWLHDAEQWLHLPLDVKSIYASASSPCSPPFPYSFTSAA